MCRVHTHSGQNVSQAHLRPDNPPLNSLSDPLHVLSLGCLSVRIEGFRISCVRNSVTPPLTVLPILFILILHAMGL